MIGALGTYLIRVCGASLIAGIILGFLQDNSHKTVIKLLCSIVLLLTVIRPFAEIPITGLARFSLPYQEEAAKAREAGEAYAARQLQTLIKSETEAYILDKASLYGVVLDVTVTVSSDTIARPISVVIRGTVSADIQNALQQIIADDLNIAKENQTWIG